MWIVGIVGLLGAAIAGGLSFIPPPQISTGSPAIYVGLLLASTAIEVAIPFIIFASMQTELESGRLRISSRSIGRPKAANPVKSRRSHIRWQRASL